MGMTFITPAAPVDHPRFLHQFACGDVCRAELRITGLGLYRAYINGRRVGGDYLTPGFNDYDAYLRVQTYDVTELLAQENVIEVYMGEGWYMGRLGFDGGQTCRWGSRYLLAAELTITNADGSATRIAADGTWRAAPSCITGGNIYDGETRDDTRAVGETVPCVAAETDYRLEDQFSPPIRAVGELKPTLIITPKGEQVLDFGQNMAGVIRFVNRLPAGRTMRIQTGEVLQQGSFYRDNLRTAKSEFVYTSDGVVKDVEPMFTFFGFRYAKVEGVDAVAPGDYTAVVLSSDLRQTLEAGTGHAGINQLMRNTWWGQRSNFLDVPTDCPQRDERLGWTADTQVFVNTACYQMDCKAFYTKYMRDMRADQVLYGGGDLPQYSPSLKGAGNHGGAVWADAGTIIPWDIYMNYGDKALLAETYPMMRDYAEYLIREDARLGGTHVVYDQFTYGDWLAQDGITPQSLKGSTDDAYIQGVYCMHSIELTAKAAAELGYEQDAARYGEFGAQIRSALLDEYVSPAGNLTMDTQTGFVLALRYGLFRDREKMIAGLRRRLRLDLCRIRSGFTGAPLMLPVLFDNGMGDMACRMLLREQFPGWLYSVNLGATTIWERWNSLESDGSISGTGMNSLNHYAYGSVCEAIYSRIMGLRCAAPGWTRAQIAPYIDGRLGHAFIRFDSPAGLWSVSWRIEEDGLLHVEAQVPQGAAAHLVLPDHPQGYEAELSEGSYSYTYQPTRDYLHPYSLDSLCMDVMANREAAELIRQAEPVFYAQLSDPDGEYGSMTVRQAAGTMWHINPQAVLDLEPALRAIRV
ncbi:MAG: family 78 glycoside hydrolase catalytic domain [Clostridia bacterium]|nr:family 78 glycoside hydrolase catalytic domain [Clostridia bacterium]